MVGRSTLKFRTRRNIAEIPAEYISRPAGRARVATAEACALMLTSDLDMSGGIDNAATVIVELAESKRIKESKLIETAAIFPLSAVRRTGWILDNFVPDFTTNSLARMCKDVGTGPSFLTTHVTEEGKFDKKWSLIINRKVEPDI